MRVLITGGTGFLGGAAARRLQAHGNDVTVLGRNAQAGETLTQEGIRFIQADLVDRAAVHNACQHQDIVIHCAALASPWGDYASFYSANVIGTQNLVDACIALGISRIVNLSTPSLYFDYTDRVNIKESDPLPRMQVTHYGKTKLIADREMDRALAAGIFVVHLRPRAVFGAGDTNILGRVARMAQRGRIPLIGGGATLVDMTYLDNAIDAMLLALEAPPEANGRVFNITNGEPIPSRTMFEMLFKYLNKPVRFIAIPYGGAITLASVLEGLYSILGKRSEPPLTRYLIGLLGHSQTLDISEARRVLGYSPRISLEEGFRRYAEWWTQKETV